MISYLKSNTWRFKALFVALLCLAFSACEKNDISLEDPYAGGKAALGVQFISKVPYPSSALPGDVVEIKVKGLKQYEGSFKLYINELEAQITDLTDDLIKFRVPENASTGGLWVTLNDPAKGLDSQTFFGPPLQIDGKVNLDPAFGVVNGSNNVIYDALRLPSGSFALVGAFTDYELTATAANSVGRLAQITNAGKIDNGLKFGLGANGLVTVMSRITSGEHNGKFLIAGNFSSFNSKRTTRSNINNITRLNPDGTLDSTFVDVVNLTPNDPTKNRDTVPAFNGGVTNYGTYSGTLVKRLFATTDYIYAVGNFDRYVRSFYERSTFDTKVTDVTTIRQLVRMKPDGAMDSTWRYNISDKTSPAAGNGSISDAVQLADGSIIVVGNFTTFDGVPRNRIAKILPDGSLDQSFNIGSGANDVISSITYNANSGKILLAGFFTTFNGKALDGVAMLNTDGSVVSTFNFADVTGGVPAFAAQLNSGKIIVSGGFDRYGPVLRQGFMILNADGTLAKGYNNTGIFQGYIYDMVETTSDAGNPAILLVGSIYRFNNKIVHNVVNVEILN